MQLAIWRTIGIRAGFNPVDLVDLDPLEIRDLVSKQFITQASPGLQALVKIHQQDPSDDSFVKLINSVHALNILTQYTNDTNILELSESELKARLAAENLI